MTFIIAVVGGVSNANAETSSDRSEWLEQIRQYKRTYFAKELSLASDQQKRFFPLYEEMEDQLQHMDDEAKAMEARVSEAEEATDLEYDKAAEALYDQKIRQAELEREYMGKFRDILSARQLFELKGVERKFSREMMRQHHRLRSSKELSPRSR